MGQLEIKVMDKQKVELGIRIDQGSWGTVYEAKEDSALAIKVFKKNAEKSYEDVLWVFENEVAAYEQVRKCNELSQYVPVYFGQAEVVIDPETHYPEMAFIMQRLGKLDTYNPSLPDEISKLFIKCGIEGTDDISSLKIPDTNEVKYIDFSLKRYEVQEGGDLEIVDLRNI